MTDRERITLLSSAVALLALLRDVDRLPGEFTFGRRREREAYEAKLREVLGTLLDDLAADASDPPATPTPATTQERS